MRRAKAATARVSLMFAAAVLITAAANPPRLRARAGGDEAEGTQARARELWEQAVAAKGGRERLRRIESLYVERAQPGGDRDYYFYAFPRYWFNYTYGGRREDTAKTVHNGPRGVTWWLPPNGATARQSESSADDLSAPLVAQFTYLLVTRWLEPRPLSARRERLGLRRVDVLEVDAGGWLVTYYLDPETHLPVKLIAPEGELPRARGERHKVVQFEDYAPVDGVMMPRAVTHSHTTVRRKWKERVAYEFNPRHDPRFFEQPPTLRTTPHSWRADGEAIRKP